MSLTRAVPAAVPVVFSADDGTDGREPWVSDGSGAGTQLLEDVNPGPAGSSPAGFGAAGGRVPFGATDGGATGAELWASDGTPAGTEMIADTVGGPAGGFPSVIAFKPDLALVRVVGAGGDELWATDGTVGGTNFIAAVGITGTNQTQAGAESITRVGPIYGLFAGIDENGAELWRTDGTPFNTLMIRDINPGPAGSFPSHIRERNSAGYFRANDGAAGSELWATGTSPSTTRLFRDINPGPGGSAPFGFTDGPRGLYFAADGGENGTELWRMRQSLPSAIAEFDDINPGPASSSPRQFTTLGNTLLFTARSASAGEELWTVVRDKTAPTVRLRGRRTQRSSRKLVAKVTVGEDSTVRLRQRGRKATVKSSGGNPAEARGAKRTKLKPRPRRKRLAAGETAKLKLVAKGKAKRKLGGLLRRGKRVKIKIRATATDEHGNRSSRKRTVTLRRKR